MKFLIALVALIGYAAASVIAPLGHLGWANAGDVQAAHINAAVASQDLTRAAVEGQVRHAEAVHLANSEAVRQVSETNRDLNENAYWNSVAAGQNYVAAAQSQAAALSGIAAANAGHLAGYGYGIAAPLAHGYAAPLAHGYAAPLAAPWGLGYGHAW